MTKNLDYAPVVIFAYNRIDHLKLCIDALRLNEESKNTSLYIYSDGPKDSADLKKIEGVRIYIKSISGFKKIEYNFSETNQGLSRSIINGITDQFLIHEKLIVLEDDIIVSKYFLSYMNRALSIYENDFNVASIHGYTYPIRPLPNTFFIRGADCWGWGTWKRSWNDFEQDGEILLNNLIKENLTLKFNLFGAYNYKKMLLNQINRKNDSWAIRWHASNFLKNKLTLYPGLSLVDNIGADGTGTNFKNRDESYKTVKSDVDILFEKILVEESIFSRNMFVYFFYKRKVLKLFQKLFI